VGINRFSDIEERKRNETEAKAGDEVAAENKGDTASRLQASEGPKENEEKREVVKKLKERES
jgi:predicted transcriptional regulator YheO